MKKILVLIALLLAVMPALADTTPEQERALVDKVYKELPVMSESLDYIIKNYVDEDKIKGDLLFHGAIKGMISTLDVHSHFMDLDQFNELQTETSGVFGGIGVEITLRSDILTIVAPIEKSPAWQQGIRSGDRIIKIEGELTKGKTVDDAIKKIRGPKGTKVKLSIAHEGEDQLVEVEITRDNIKIQSVDSYILSDNFGYIRLRNFIESSGRDIGAALEKLEKANVRGVILDLRGNPGGLLDVSVDIADRFLSGDKLIVYTQGRISSMNRKYTSTGGGSFGEKVPLIVMVNKGSASASEIVTGALQDNKRAVVMGTQSFGKASVQSIFRLSDGSGLRLTTAYYYTPLGRKIHEKGITPDIISEDKFPGDQVWRLNYFEHFANYAKKYIKANPTADEKVKVEDKMVDDMIKDAKAAGFVISDLEIEKNRSFLKSFIRAELIKVLKGDQESEKARVEDDDTVKRALDIFKSAEIMNVAK